MKRELSAKQKETLARHACRPGQTGDAGDRSPARALTVALREKLASCPPGERRTVAELLADRLVALALDGSLPAFEIVLDRSEGSVRQRIGLDGDLSVRPFGPVATLHSFRNWSNEQLDAHYAECQEILNRYSPTTPKPQ